MSDEIEDDGAAVQMQAAPSAYHNSTYNNTTAHHDFIADRTGELLKAAIGVAEDHLRPNIASFEDPLSGTRALAIIGQQGLYPLDRERIFAPFAAKPDRRKGVSHHTRLPSFIAHVNRFKTGNSAVFAIDDMTAPYITAVLDYHEPVNITDEDGNSILDSDADPAFCAHRTVYDFPLSPEWKTWMASNGKAMTQTDFAAFLEDQIGDIDLAEVSDLSEAAQAFVSKVAGEMATPTKLIELSRGLAVYENSVVRETRNLSSGEGEILFQSEHVDASGAPLRVPNYFVICIPVLAQGDFYRLVARLRYRKAPGGLSFWYELWRPDLSFTDAFNEACGQVQIQTGLPLFFGSPEA